MATLATIVSYIKGPVSSSPGIIDRLLGRDGKTIYYVNDQVYLRGESAPLMNYDIKAYPFSSSNVPNRESFADSIRLELRRKIKDGIRFGENKPIIPPECINIETEFVE